MTMFLPPVRSIRLQQAPAGREEFPRCPVIMPPVRTIRLGRRFAIAAALGVAAIVPWAGGCGAPPKETSAPATRRPPPAPSQAGQSPSRAPSPARSPVASPARGAPENANDACADHLHEASGALLLYYGKYRRLPQDPRELTRLPGFDDLDLTCPVSGEPYAYDPNGLPGPKAGTVLILYDATPAHGRMRWAVSAVVPRGTEPLLADVLAVPEARFRAIGASGAGRSPSRP